MKSTTLIRQRKQRLLGRRVYWMALSTGLAASVLVTAPSSLFAQISLPGGAGGIATPPVGAPIGPDVTPRLPQPATQLPTQPLPSQPALPADLDEAPVVGTQGEGLAQPLRLNLRSGAEAAQQTNLGMDVQRGTRGLMIRDLNNGSLAAQAGFRVGDEVIAVNRSWVRNQQQLVSQLEAAAQSSGRAWVLVNRNGQQQWVNLNFQSQTRPSLGVMVVDRNGAVRITDVTSGSAAAAAGLQAGDQVRSINGINVSTSDEFIAQVQAAARANSEAVIQVERDGVEQTLRAQLRQANELADNAGDAAGDAVAAARQSMGELRQDLDALGDQVGEGLAAQVNELRQQAAAAEQRLNDLTERQRENAENQVDALLGQIRGLKNELSDVANRTTGRAREAADRAVQRANQLEQQLVDRSEQLRTRVAGQARETIAATQERVAATRDELSARMDTLQNRLAQLKESATEETREQWDALATRAAQLKDRLGEAGQQAQEETRARLTDVRQDARQLLAETNRLAEQTKEEARGELAEFRDTLATFTRDVNDYVSAQLNDVEATLDGASGANVSVRAREHGAWGITLNSAAGNLTITAVEEGSVGARAGLRAGDRITAINNRQIRSAAELDSELSAAAAGDATIQVQRDGETRRVRIPLGANGTTGASTRDALRVNSP